MAAILFLVAAPAALLLLGQYSDIDLALADYMFDPALGQFPWRNAWLTNRFGHVLLKRFLVALGLIPIVLCLIDAIRPFASWPHWFRIGMRTVALSALAIPLAVSVLKHFSASHCPWDIDRYGGTAPYVRLLDAMPPGVYAGHCFPAGHATSALWLVSTAAFWLPHRPRMAALVGFAMTGIGFTIGWMQQMRGAHFLSHTLWSIWIALFLTAAIFLMLNRLGKRNAPLYKGGSFPA